MSSNPHEYLKKIEEIKEFAERYRKIIHNLSEVIIEIDSNGKYTFTNQKYFELFGYRPEEVIGKSIFKYIHPNDISKMRESIKFGKMHAIQYRLHHKNGWYIPILANANIFLDKGKLKIVAIIRKVQNEVKLGSQVKFLERMLTDLKEKYQVKNIVIKDSEKKLSHLFETSPYAIIILNFRGKIIECNPATKKVLNYNEGELKDKSLLDIFSLPPKTLEIIKNMYSQLTKGEKVDPIDIQVYTKDGKKRWGRASASLIKLYNEILIQVIIQDINKEKLLEETLSNQ